MKIRRIFLFWIISCLFSSCETDATEEIKQNTYKAEFVKQIRLSEYFSSLDYVFLEESPDGLFINADKILYFQNRWYIMDKKLMSILCFEENGKFLFKIHSVGKGPGEYQLLTGMLIHEKRKELWAQCRMRKKLLIYNLDGQLLREESVSRVGIDMIQTNESDIIAYDEEGHNFNDRDSTDGGVYLMDNEFKRKDQLFNLPSGTVYYELKNNNSFSRLYDSTFFLSPSDSLICFPPNLNPIVTGVFDFGKHHLSQKLKQLPNLFENYPDVIESGMVIWKENLVVSSQSIFLNLGFQNTIWFGIIDRASSQFRITQGFLNDINTEIFVFPTARKSDKELVGFLSTDYLLAFEENLSKLPKSEKEKESTKKLISFIEKGLERSGNILVIAKTKNLKLNTNEN